MLCRFPVHFDLYINLHHNCVHAMLDDKAQARHFFSECDLIIFALDPPKKRIDSLRLTLNGTARLSLGDLSEGSPLAGRRGLAVQKLYAHFF